MTTAAEIRQIVSNYGAEAGRVTLQPSSLLGTEEGRDEVAREIVALANRDGGRIVFGIDAAGRFEGRLGIDLREAQQRVEELVAARVVPSPVVSVEHLGDQDGELVVVAVQRRRGSPHAFARVTATGAVGARAYFVRDGNRTRPVSDEQLAWLFRVTDDPAVSLCQSLLIQSAADSIRPTAALPQPAACGLLAALLGGVSDDVDATIAADSLRPQAYAELAGWAFLRQLSRSVEGVCDGDELERVSLDALPVPVSNSVFSGQEGGLRGLLGTPPRRGLRGLLGRQGRSPEYAVPRGTDIQVDLLPRQQKARTTLTHPAFVAAFTAVADGSGSGLGWPGAEDESAASWAWSKLRVEFTCSMPFPASAAASSAEGRATGEGSREELLARVRHDLEEGWDSDRLARSLDPRFLERALELGTTAC